MRKLPVDLLAPGLLALLGGLAVGFWMGWQPHGGVRARVPGMDEAPPKPRTTYQRPIPGEPVLGEGVASLLSGAWPWFRGPRYDAISHDTIRLARRWPEGGPPRLWSVTLGEGYAAAAASEGRVYVLDHVRDLVAQTAPTVGGKPGDRSAVDRSADVLRCLSLDDGREIWHNGYPVVVPPYHGCSRTIPAVSGGIVVTIGPKCHVVGWDARTGKALWLIDMVADYDATVPEWYTGQCPLIDPQLDQLVLAPGGKTLLVAVDYRTGVEKWASGNPRRWKKTHSSVMPMELANRRMYVYCGSGGVAGVAADTGEILWETTDWQIATATCPSPVPIGDGRIFLCGGYNAGAKMLRVTHAEGRFKVETLYSLTPRQFSSEQQTPVLYEGYLYGVRQHDKKLVCLDLDGREMWNSGKDKFGAAPYMVADGLIFVMNDAGRLTIVEATPRPPYRPLASAQLWEDGVDAWGPMALVAGRLIVRDFTRMVCLDVAEKEQQRGQ